VSVFWSSNVDGIFSGSGYKIGFNSSTGAGVGGSYFQNHGIVRCVRGGK